VPRFRQFAAAAVAVAVVAAPLMGLIERGNFDFGDDLSSVDMDGEILHAFWGDNRSGFQTTFFGRVPLSAS
jgi:hypothetical protein